MQQVQVRAARTVASVLAGRSLQTVLGPALAAAPTLGPAERGQLQDLCYGTLRFLGELRVVADALLARALTDASLQALLWVALYQLRHTRAAPYAVVDAAVDACAALGQPRARGLTNAVLRNALRQQGELDRVARQTDTGRFSHPQWWIERLRREQPAAWAQILAQGNGHPPLTLRVNRRRGEVADLLADCAQRGIAARAMPVLAPGSPAASAVQSIVPQALAHCVRIEQALPVDQLPGFAAGSCSVQDAGAQLAAPLLAARPGMRVLDACAAPGGKAAHLLELADVELVALDSDAQRLQRVQSNLDRLGLSVARPGVAAPRLHAVDAAHVPAWWDGRAFDRILIDAPCSGSGVVRRHPDIKWLRREADLQRFAQQQRRLVAALWPLLAAGGRLLYCTCSVFAPENAEVAAWIDADCPGARRVSCTQHAEEAAPSGAQALELLPDADHDGFYYALFTKE